MGWALLSTLHRKQAEVWELMNMRCGAEKKEKVCRLSYHDGLGPVQGLSRVHRFFTTLVVGTSNPIFTDQTTGTQ